VFDSIFFYAVSVFLTSFVMSFISFWTRQKLLSQEQLMEWQAEIKAWKEEMERATKTGDKKLLARLRRREKRILQIQAKMSKKQMISMILNFAMFLGVWQILGFYLGNKTVAYLPFSIPFLTGPPPFPLDLFLWYFICSFVSAALVSRILGIPMGLGTQLQKK